MPARYARRSLHGIVAALALALAACEANGVEAFTRGTPPVAHWRFDEGSGSVAADSGGARNDGVLQTGASWGAGGFARARFVNPASVRLDGARGYVTISIHDLPALGERVSISVWVAHDRTLGGIANFVSLVNMDVQASLQIGLQSRMVVLWTFGQADLLQTAPPDGAGWYHVACTFDGNVYRLYIDGVLRGSALRPRSRVPLTDALIGAFIGPGRGFQQELYAGLIDDVRIYDRALADGEVAALASGADVP